MKKLKNIKGYVKLTLGKLPGIPADLVRLGDNWQEWDFCQLVDSLRRWTERNSKTAGNSEKNFRRENLFQVRDKDKKPAYACVYYEKPGHKFSECELVSGNREHRLILSKKKLCFNCTGPKHCASDCRSNDIEGIKCRALIDTGAGASYASSTLIDQMNKKPIRKQYKRIETIMSLPTKSVPVYSVQFRDSDHLFKFQTERNRLEKSVLSELPNPEYRNLPKFTSRGADSRTNKTRLGYFISWKRKHCN